MKKNLSTKKDRAAECNISPISTSSKKHQIAQLSGKNKTPKCEGNIDVHTLSSTPVTTQVRGGVSQFRSPTSSFTLSQDNLPEVIWDYTSPKLAKGKRREINMTVDELLQIMYRGKIPEGNQRSSHHIQLLEKWMATQNVVAPEVKPQVVKKKENGKKGSRRLAEEMQQFLESMKSDNNSRQNTAVADENTPSKDDTNAATTSGSNAHIDKNSFIWDEDNESSEELWGDDDDNSEAFIVRATQDQESSIPESISSPRAVSIPETLKSCSTVTDHHKLNERISDVDFGDESCDDEFAFGDDTFSMIPDDVLEGTSCQESKVEAATSLTLNKCEFYFEGSKVHVDEQCSGNSGTTLVSEKTKTPDIFDSNSSEDLEKSFELFNNSADDEFFSKPEVLDWMDRVESQMSQPHKCTPTEIAQKREETIRKRKKMNEMKNALKT